MSKIRKLEKELSEQKIINKTLQYIFYKSIIKFVDDKDYKGLSKFCDYYKQKV